MCNDIACALCFRALAVWSELVYQLVFHILLGRTLGMRLLKIKVIDVFGDRPSPGRCVVRCAG